MSFFTYLAQSFFFGILLFFKHWYIDALQSFYGAVLLLLRRVERMFALRVQWHFLFSPLYQERNIIGYGLGFILRGGALLIGGILAGVVVIVGAVLYGAWALFPLVALVNAIRYWFSL